MTSSGGRTNSLGQEIALPHLLFTAHTLIIASLKEEVARASSASEVVRKLPPVERESRLTKLREKLPGVDLTRHQEPPMNWLTLSAPCWRPAPCVGCRFTSAPAASRSCPLVQ